MSKRWLGMLHLLFFFYAIKRKLSFPKSGTLTKRQMYELCPIYATYAKLFMTDHK